ncbi:MAG TPA: serine hydrolase domain-containing protein [Steroidobacteraceae bacterium]|jgi:CubicO group peptidase (beta-lactamase class C family)|nr:serine hydrolase domain-containing protein [Steroidobacteraceae bacterium]
MPSMPLRRGPTLFLTVVLLAFGSAWASESSRDPLPRAQPEEVGMSSERLARLTAGLKRYTDEGKVAGSVALVARRGKLVYLEAFGDRDREAHARMRTDSIFRIASQTKAVVVTGAMMLVEQGKLLLTDPVAKYFPEFGSTTVAVPKDGGGYDVVPAKRPITIRDLMTHTSGIGYGMGVAADQWKKAGIQGWYFADRNEPIAATVSRMAALPFDAQPREKWVYGYNIDILGAIIEKVAGMPLDEYMRTAVTGPLGMSDTAFYLPKEKRDRLTVVYSMNGKPQLERAPAPGGMIGQGAYVDGPRKSFSGGAGFLSTAGDYARFLQMILNGGQLDGKRLLSRKTVELMTTDHLGDVPFQPGVGIGLGFSVVTNVGERGEPGSVGEYGWGGAYHSTYWVDPREQLIVVYLTQLIPAGDIDDFGKLRSLVYAAIVD